ncbi:glycosyl hydrolase family 95 catalytic domain-containing protein [Paenibacillus sacheonensis]|uniref:Glycosyl hydrolase family 95 catalytic domain-containing protein n=1 Tax=Paenibacillus sacheonensis TaxID=742054 RepID=A0A7X4YQD7_9BACL|nr:hypothetical protein [Paenibacillus sacheonensis]MBM7566404.1 hypothetical protein [Paenibacillus sacheonensis]NBC70603.1 hypothetical protein [Paenibacillus sacheonensis]
MTPEGFASTDSADHHTKTNALRIVSQYQGEWISPPLLTDTGEFSDAPLLGNGDIGAMILGSIDDMAFVVGKNEFISQTEGITKALSRVLLRIPGMVGASYRMEQQLANAEAVGTFTLNGHTITTRSRAQATDSIGSLMITHLDYEGNGPLEAFVEFEPGKQNPIPVTIGYEGDVLLQDVRADYEDRIKGCDTVKVRLATRIVGAAGKIEGNRLRFALQPGQSYVLLTSVVSNHDDADYEARAIRAIQSMSLTEADGDRSNHLAWWASFWSKSFVEIANKEIEKHFYGSLYLLGSSIRKGKQAPGLYGSWVMKNAAWGGIAPINYNYEAPYYCTIPTNHLELAENYEKQITDWVPYAEANAAKHGFTGVYYEAYPASLPNGAQFSSVNWTGLDQLERNCFMAQKSNAALAASNMILRYYYTRDAGYARTVYDGFLKKVGRFWTDYLRWDGSRYVIDNDYVHEGGDCIFPQTNPLTSLGLVRLLFQGLIAISEDLGTDSELRTDWQHKLDHMSAFPTFIRNGRTVFRNQESGTSADYCRKYYDTDEDYSEWSSVCAVPEMSLLYPGGQLGLLSDPALLQIARDTIAEHDRWQDNNMTCFYYASAARAGYDPDEILNRLTELIRTRTYPNMTFAMLHGGGIENCNTVPAVLVEMLAQSFQNKLIVFANWPRQANAKFGDLMAYGHFLVSSRIAEGGIQYVRIRSMNGSVLTVMNPWEERTVRLYRDGNDAGMLTGKEFSLPTAVSEVIHMAPDGVSYDEIMERMR